MKNSILILGTILLFGFTSGNSIDEKIESDGISANEVVTADINEFNKIIEEKVKKAELLKVQAILLLKKDSNSKEGLKLVEEARLQRMMTLKYRAAIACKTRFLK